MEEGKGRVCVTGGTGFIGSWIIKRLLQDGYTVNTTVRPDPGNHLHLKKFRNTVQKFQDSNINHFDQV